jgi:hypothetical protein
MTRHLLAEWGMAAFLAIMAGMNLWNCRLLWREKQVKGISPMTVLVRSSANVWQAWFLFQLGQWPAFSAAVPATALNLVWVLMAFYYRRWPARHERSATSSERSTTPLFLIRPRHPGLAVVEPNITTERAAPMRAADTIAAASFSMNFPCDMQPPRPLMRTTCNHLTPISGAERRVDAAARMGHSRAMKKMMLRLATVWCGMVEP